MASFLECFPPDHVSELKHDHFYWGLPKCFKVMVAYLKRSNNEKLYLDYLQAAREVEKEEAMEPSCNPHVASAHNPWVMSFFPLQKLKGSQPTMTPSAWVAHLEEDSTDKEECINSKDQDGIKGVTQEFVVYLARAVKYAQQEDKHCYHCSNPDHFICDCLLVVASRADSHWNLKKGHATEEGNLRPSRKGDHAKGAPGWDTQGTKQTQTPFLNPNPFNQWYSIENVARVRVNGERCMALLNNGAQINTIMPGFIANHSLDIRPLSDLLGRWVICTGLGNAFTQPIGYITIPFQVDGSPGLWWGSNTPHSPRFVQLCGLGTHDPGHPHNSLHHEWNKRRRQTHWWHPGSMPVCPNFWWSSEWPPC